MRILVRHAPPFRRWHAVLGERLARDGHAVGFVAVGAPLRGVDTALLALERRLYRLADGWDASLSTAPGSVADPELTLVLDGSIPGCGPLLVPEFDGRRGPQAMHAALRTGEAILVSVKGGTAAALRDVVRGRVAVETTHVSARALDCLLPRLVTLLVQSVAWLDATEPAPILEEAAAPPRAASPAGFLVRGLWRKARHRLGAARGRPDHWRLALRRPGGEIETLPSDDGSRLAADPFLFADAGRLFLFYETFAYDGGKGVIACRDLNTVEPVSGGKPVPVVLEEPFHLSYPLVMRHGEAIYMLPETSSAGVVRLYRAAPFPGRWEPAAILVGGRTLSDATPVFHDGIWWLFATAHDDGSSWDQLCLFHAPDLLGPWTPHVRNPVLIDAAAARPAGRMWHENGALMRPAQDCRRGYGDAINVCRVDRLDVDGFRQTVVRRIEPPAGHGARGVHTINRAAGWETMDLKVRHPSPTR